MQLKNISQALLPHWQHQAFNENIFISVSSYPDTSLHGCAGSFPSLFVADFFLKLQKTLLYILDDKESALYTCTELEELVGKPHVYYYPESYLEPYQKEKTQKANLVLRTEVLHQLYKNKDPKIIVTHACSLCEKVILKDDFNKIFYSVKLGDTLRLDFAENLLLRYGFKMQEFVSEPGEFSLRGGILDVFSYAHKRPFRLTFFGDVIENIQEFDLETQLSVQKLEHCELMSDMTRIRREEKAVFMDLLEDDSFIVSKNIAYTKKIIHKFFLRSQEVYPTLHEDPRHSLPEHLFVTEETFTRCCDKFRKIDFCLSSSVNKEDAFSQENKLQIFFKQNPQPNFHKNFELLIEDLEEKKQLGYDLWISFSSDLQKDRLEKIFSQLGREISFKFFKSQLHEGFIDIERKILVYTDHQIFDRYQRFHSKNSFAKSQQITLKDMMSLKVGDYITHIDHGIGKFMGLVKINNDGKTQECFKLSYKNGDLLYVSIHSLHKISKYNGPEGKEIRLSVLGSGAWKSLKQKTKSKVKQIAFDLIQLYAQRKLLKGFAFSPDTYLQNELEASFIYEDTPDQEKAVRDVKRDMESETVMDRLICGDVGFGKTEVAIRAAFKAVTDGKQVVVLVPTTVLAFQHYRSFSKRLEDFPVTISYLNRFRTARQKSEIIRGLKTGKIDIIIGTHQLASEKIQFKDLGLLIIDEEHKFGVSVKDKLKTFKKNVDTLTLTATPIPRTLQFSLMATRDLSVIKTPPPNRLPVETYLISFEEEILRNAIFYELERNGQVYFIHNSIENLKEIAGIIQHLVPDAKVAVGHGQMEGKELEEIILDFMEGKYDVLVSTTIVESGVDVPNANTLFINDAQKFGMADLHQIRGRVGRSNRKAFCYLIVPPIDRMSSAARKRLEAIVQFSDLGSGFQIAMKDLEIRGAGDLLGAEQTGFINEMGFDTYQKILQEAVEELQDDPTVESIFAHDEERKRLLLISTKKEVNIDTDLELMIPDFYVQSTEERLVLYQRLSQVETAEKLRAFENELTDRFGEIPQQMRDLLRSIELKWLASAIGFEKLVVKNKVFLGYFPSSPKDKFYQSERFHKIITYLTSHPAEVSLKEKLQGETRQLFMRKEGIESIQDINQLLLKIMS
ncbi:MAG: transcription-repair coupling factor [Bergeyella sp.]|nr:transcription-repair coupling factor [Bergeyella sp.]